MFVAMILTVNGDVKLGDILNLSSLNYSDIDRWVSADKCLLEKINYIGEPTMVNPGIYLTKNGQVIDKNKYEYLIRRKIKYRFIAGKNPDLVTMNIHFPLRGPRQVPGDERYKKYGVLLVSLGEYPRVINGYPDFLFNKITPKNILETRRIFKNKNKTAVDLLELAIRSRDVCSIVALNELLKKNKLGVYTFLSVLDGKNDDLRSVLISTFFSKVLYTPKQLKEFDREYQQRFKTSLSKELEGLSAGFTLQARKNIEAVLSVLKGGR